MTLPTVSRADLLLALANLAEGPQAESRLAAHLGFELRQDALELHLPGHKRRAKTVAKPQAVPATPEAASQPQQRNLQIAVTHAELHPAATGADLAPAAPLGPDAGRPARQDAPPTAPLLVRPARLVPALRRSLQRPSDAGLDLPALLLCLTSARLVRRLPRCQQGRLGDDIWVVVDAGEAMEPYFSDLGWLRQQAQRLYGPGRVRAWVVRDSPGQLLHAHGQPQPPGRALPKPPPGQRVLLLSHLGLLNTAPEAREAWLAWLQQARAQGGHAVAWLPCTPAWVDSPLARVASLHCLVPEGSLRRQAGRPIAAVLTPAKAWPQRDELLTHAALSLHLSPERLRDLRLTVPALRAEPALEGLCWTAQPLVGRSHYSRALTPAGIQQLRPGWAKLSAAAQQRAWQVMCHHQAWRGSFLAAAEVLLAAAHARPEVLGAGFQAARATAERLYDDLWAHARAGAAGREEAAFAADLLARQAADLHWLQRQPMQLARLVSLAGWQAAPAGLPGAVLAQAQAELNREAAHAQVLELRSDGLWLCVPATGAALPGRWPLWRLQPASRYFLGPPGGSSRRLGAQALNGPIATSDQLPLQLSTERETLIVETLPRPRWAQEWGRDEIGLYAVAPMLADSHERRVRAAEGEPVNRNCPPLRATSLGWLGEERELAQRASLRLGVEPKFGAYADLSIQGATQRLRWLPPGEFWMGSSEAERKRITHEEHRKWAQNESPRHRVAVTQGLWLADTACTQALWQALMGINPSHFAGDPMLPVENVSHEDVQRFLARLQALLPGGLTAGLPTEAEWEYACRAGSDTAFGFGEHLTHEQANVDELEGFAQPGAGPDGSRGKTVPVASLPPNAWGLFEMHGNVWEWCADGLREYAATSEPVADPQGPQDTARFAVRGGSWIRVAGGARSAYRNAFVRSGRYGFLGFRLALRSTSTSPGTAAEPLHSPGPEARGQARRDAGPRQTKPPRRKR